MKWTDILRCPKTGQALHFDEPASVLRAEASHVTYPVIDDIADFCPQGQDRIAASYDKVATRYDPTASTLPAKVLGWIIWGRASDRAAMEKVLSLLPQRFDGVLLDVPVGTGVFTASLYHRYPNATILGVDCSRNMLRKAQAYFQEHKVRNVHLLKADAAALPMHDAGVDMILSMNGWHAFANKGGAIAEMTRVLPTGGKLIACGYVKGARRRSDWFVRHFGVRNGYFTPPFFTEDELAERFRGFTMTQQGCDQYLAWFEAVKQRV